MSKRRQYKQLVRRYLENKSSDKELEVFFDMLKEGKLRKTLESALKERDGAGVFFKGGVRSMPRWGLMAAACLLALLALAGLWQWKKQSVHTPLATTGNTPFKNDVQPGRNHAVLVLPGGQVIDLDSNTAGIVALRGDDRLIRRKSGEWVYRSGPGDTSVMYNTISAPRGGQFSFVLEDGTRVWLNAASSLRFPTAFRGGTREVDLAGEAYFEVAKDPGRVFKVRAAGMEVQVLGTHFNVNAYPDESDVRTTLLEGLVKIVKNDRATVLRPGEQASLDPEGAVRMVDDPDVAEAAVAWKNGYFSFGQADIKTVMRQIARWYDVTVRYEGPVTPAVFGGDIGRDLTLVQVLEVLEKSQVHFRLQGTDLTVLP